MFGDHPEAVDGEETCAVLVVCDKNEFIGILLELSWRENLASFSQTQDDDDKWELIMESPS